MRKDIEFKTEDGVTLRGWHYLPDSRQGKLPTIIMAHGFSAVKEMYLDQFAEVFAAAGLSSVVFDNRNFGASEGEPRQEIGPWRQLRDYRRHYLRRDACIDRPQSYWDLGIQLQRRPRARRGSDRSTSQVRRVAGAAGEWPQQRPSTCSGRLSCSRAGDV
jgi:pimeloyl-ACP methyl ester carboxylesterase